MAPAAAGKVIAAGGVDDVGSVGAGALVARYLPDGRPDPSFGTGGVGAAPSGAWGGAWPGNVAADGPLSGARPQLAASLSRRGSGLLGSGLRSRA